MSSLSKIVNISSFEKIVQLTKSSVGKVMGSSLENTTRYSLYVDGVNKGNDYSQSPITSVTMENFGLCTSAQPSIGDNYHCIIDNCFISNDVDADLYSLRNYSSEVPGRGDYVMLWWRCDGNTLYEAVWNSDFDYKISGTPYIWGDAYVNLTGTSNGSVYKSASRSAQVYATNYNEDGPSAVFIGNIGDMIRTQGLSSKGRIGLWVMIPSIGEEAHTLGYSIGLGTFEYVGEDFRQAMTSLLFSMETYPDITCSVMVADVVGGVPNYFVVPSVSAMLTYDTWYFIELAYNVDAS